MREDMWDGKERRLHYVCPIECKNKVENTSDAVIRIEGRIENLDTRINGSLEKIADFIETGKAWRSTIVAIALTLLIQIIGTIYFIGSTFRQVEINTGRLNNLEANEKILIKDHGRLEGNNINGKN